MKSIILILALCSALVACNAVPEEVKPPEADDFTQVYEENLKPANGINADVLADWQKIDTQMQALVPSKAALFSEVLFQNEVHSVAPDAKRKASLKLSQAGKIFLTELRENCWVLNASQSKSNVDNNKSELIRGALGLSGDTCSLVISDNQETKRTVTAKTSDYVKYSAVSREIAKVEVKDPAIAAASGFKSSTSTISISGNFVQYPQTSYKYASAKIILKGTFTVVLAAETVTGTITGEVNLGAVPKAQFLLEGKSSRGVIRLITKRSNNVNQYFFNGSEVPAAAVPSFLIIANDYLK